MGGFDGGLIVRQDAGFGEDIGVVAKIAGVRRLVAVDRGEPLDDLRAAAMAMHVAEAADVHEDVEAESRAGMEGAECFVVLAAVAQAQLDDLRDASGREPGDQIANLAIGVVAGGVEQRGGQLDFKRLGALNQVHQRRRGDGQTLQNLSGGLSTARRWSGSRSRWAERT